MVILYGSKIWHPTLPACHSHEKQQGPSVVQRKHGNQSAMQLKQPLSTVYYDTHRLVPQIKLLLFTQGRLLMMPETYAKSYMKKEKMHFNTASCPTCERTQMHMQKLPKSKYTSIQGTKVYRTRPKHNRTQQTQTSQIQKKTGPLVDILGVPHGLLRSYMWAIKEQAC